MRLTEAQLVAFREEGFVMLFNALDPELMRSARDLLWDSALPSLRRDDPGTWQGPFAKEDEGIVLHREGGGVQARLPAGMIHGTPTVNWSGCSWRCRTSGSEQAILDLTAHTLWEAAEQLLGVGQVVPPNNETVGQMLAHTGEDASDIATLEQIAAESDVGFRQLCARYVSSVIAASNPRTVRGGRGVSNSHAPLPEGMDHRDAADIFVAGTRARGVCECSACSACSAPPFTRSIVGVPHRGSHMARMTAPLLQMASCLTRQRRGGSPGQRAATRTRTLSIWG
jgi:hypothetical protein